MVGGSISHVSFLALLLSSKQSFLEGIWSRNGILEPIYIAMGNSILGLNSILVRGGRRGECILR